MADDRAAENPTEALGRLQTELDDFRSTVLARLTKRSTGDVEPTIRTFPKDGTLFLQGQLISRTTYAALWAFAQAEGLVVGGNLFTSGDGSTTFGLPDARGRVFLGVGTLGADSYNLGSTGGAAFRTLTTTNMPSHSHPLTGGGGTAYSVGNHGGHNSGSAPFPPGSGGGATAANGQTGNGAHGHDVQTEVYSTAVGGGGAFDNRPAFLAINWAIWL